MSWKENEICSAWQGSHINKTSYHFDQISNFSFEQAVHEIGEHSSIVQTHGKVQVVRADANAESKIQVDVISHASDPELTNSDLIRQTDDRVTVQTPLYLSSGARRYGPCVHLYVIIRIASGTTLENFNISTQDLSITFDEGLCYQVTKMTKILSKSGKVHMPESDSDSTGCPTPPSEPDESEADRETIIDLQSDSIHGTYHLYDLLSITSQSGSIHITVIPHNASSRDPTKPAVLQLSSNSGSIRVSIPAIRDASSIPDRDYQTSLSTRSGSIHADVIHGSMTSMSAYSGRIDASIWPWGHNDSRSEIKTDTRSGSMDVTVRPSLSHPLAPMRKLYSSHVHLSGSATLRYPNTWEGRILGETGSGNVRIDWPGVRILKDAKEDWFRHKIEAVKGNGEGILKFSGNSGRTTLEGSSSCRATRADHV